MDAFLVMRTDGLMVSRRYLINQAAVSLVVSRSLAVGRLSLGYARTTLSLYIATGEVHQLENERPVTLGETEKVHRQSQGDGAPAIEGNGRLVRLAAAKAQATGV